MSMQQRPLELPELRRHIAQYLDQPTLKACTLVNRSWHSEFQPLVWQTFRFSSLLRRPLSDAGLGSISKYAIYIRRLCAHYLDDHTKIPAALHSVLARQCQSLTSLDTIIPNDAEWQVYTALIAVNKQLQRVHLRNRHGFKQYIAADQLPPVLVGHQQLRLLTIDGSVSVATLRQILETVPSLEEIHIGNASTPSLMLDMMKAITSNPPSTAPTTSLFKLQRLDIDDVCEDPAMATLLAQCPYLETLRLPNMTRPVCTALCKMFSIRGQFPQLRRLTLSSDKVNQHRRRAAILESVPRQQLVQVALYTAGSDEIRQLIDRQNHSLEDVFVRSDDHGLVVEFLARCRRLKRLSVDGDRLVDVRHLLAKTWVCQGLEVFDVAVGVDRQCKDATMLGYAAAEKAGFAVKRSCSRRREEEGGGGAGVGGAGGTGGNAEDHRRMEHEQAEMLFLQRLGQLMQLRQLEKAVDNFFRPKVSSMDLSWRLSNGLLLLAGLSQLERLHLGSEPTQIGEAELLFMKVHWPRLRLLNSYKPLPKEARDWIRVHWPGLKVDEGLFAPITLLPE
ncbi:hypothetical protein DFQ27_008024 [Actinomortierella ambigua]|uniref:F-box domain-containing protein n=1 Tax=Actinomortierella ambigua TaxID=1343610 RepID=A0A9P6PRH9_9FUNG|nr:hypothetical protein DFQ27_008024 [Actinomortierella ambigua]